MLEPLTGLVFEDQPGVQVRRSLFIAGQVFSRQAAICSVGRQPAHPEPDGHLLVDGLFLEPFGRR
jgi:hypothetical protein